MPGAIEAVSNVNGVTASLGSEDKRTVEIPRGRTVALRLHVGFLSSLLQHLGRRTQALRRGAADGSENAAALVGFAAWPPLDVMRWGEYAARDATDLAGVADGVKDLADRWSGDLVSALGCVAGDFRGQVWPQDRVHLVEVQDWLAARLSGAKDTIVEGLRRGLMVDEDEQPLDVVLVRQSYEPVGGHSHPALVDVSRFAGASLVEAVFHEIGHELLGRSIGSRQSALIHLNNVARTCGPSRCSVHDVLHLALFGLAGSLVTKHFDSAHRPLLFENERMSRSLRRAGVVVATEEATAMLESFASGEVDLPTLAQFLISRARTSAVRPK
jgi:hypothetical protein